MTKINYDIKTKRSTTEELTSAEIAAENAWNAGATDRKKEEVREERNCRLRATDWTQGADVPSATKSKWVSYRQSLRDVPTQSGFPTSVTWPTEPS
tara:strand:+ start:150 stop:437 length:288 start_codon:yes stop_codon:yes gene_type:complete